MFYNKRPLQNIFERIGSKSNQVLPAFVGYDMHLPNDGGQIFGNTSALDSHHAAICLNQQGIPDGESSQKIFQLIWAKIKNCNFVLYS
jgi:hypothetical protein